MSKKKNKKKNISKVKLSFLLIILLLIGCIVYLLLRPIKNIYIINNNIVRDKEIIELAQINNYPRFFLTYFNGLEDKIKKNNYIKDVEIKRDIRGKIYIYIKEYNCLLIRNNKVVLSSGEEVDNMYDIDYLPILINDTNIDKKFINAFSKIDSDTLSKISHIEYVPTDIDNERYKFYMVDSNCVYITLSKMDKVNKYNSIIKELENKKGNIYLDSGNYVEIKG